MTKKTKRINQEKRKPIYLLGLIVIFLFIMACSLAGSGSGKDPVSTEEKPTGEIINYPFSGTWKGKLTQDPGGTQSEFNFEMTLTQNGHQIEGISRIEVISQPKYYGVMKVKGQIEGQTLTFQENSIIEDFPEPNTRWCIKNGKLNLRISKNELFIDGDWSSPDCTPGYITLNKQYSYQQSNLFIPPTTGYLGLKYKEPYGDNRGLHKGIDIWASDDTANNGNRGSPVYAVYDGNLGRTGSGVEICHPKIIQTKSQLPSDLVCTYYGHLTDLPNKIAELEKDTCPNGVIWISQGELIGYMDNKDMVGNSGIVHLHFSVAKQNPLNGCWTNETILENTLDPFLYLGLTVDDYGWLSKFP